MKPKNNQCRDDVSRRSRRPSRPHKYERRTVVGDGKKIRSSSLISNAWAKKHTTTCVLCNAPHTQSRVPVVTQHATPLWVASAPRTTPTRQYGVACHWSVRGAALTPTCRFAGDGSVDSPARRGRASRSRNPRAHLLDSAAGHVVAAPTTRFTWRPACGVARRRRFTYGSGYGPVGGRGVVVRFIFVRAFLCPTYDRHA